MSAARVKFNAVANFDATDIEAPIAYVTVFDGADAADSKKKGSRWVMKVIDLQRTMDRAVVCWDEDREIYIDKLSERLKIDPMGVSRALSRSKQGIAWLLENWDGLISALESQGSWTEEQYRLAMDLLGIPVELRAGNPRISPESDAAALEKVVETELDRLDERLTGISTPATMPSAK